MSTNTNFTDHFHKINDHRKELIKALAPSGADFAFGGAHRCWIKECAIKTAEDYIAHTKNVLDAGFPFIPVFHIAIPMPPAWNGVRPAETTEYGHPASKGKDWRHFENTLRWVFAKEGWLGDTIPLNDWTEIAFVADRMINVAKNSLVKLKEEDFKDKPPSNKAVLVDYNSFSQYIAKEMEGTKTQEHHDILHQFPAAIRPMVAMGMCDAGTPDA